MKICYFPAYQRESGSSRLRVYMIQEKLKEWGHDVWLQSSPFSADIIVIQKCINGDLLRIAREAREREIPVVFDFCDPGPFEELIVLANVVTADSQGLIDWAKERVNQPIHGRVIDNPIDYIDTPLPIKDHQKDSNLDIVYFAFPYNLPAFQHCRPALERLRKEGFQYNFSYISGERRDNHFSNFDCKWIEWRYETFSRNLREFDLAVLPQAWDWKGPCKQIDACSHNLPAVCEDIPSNRKLYYKAGVQEFLAETDDEWYSSIKRAFDPNVRNTFIEKVVPIVWKNYSLDVITKKWLSLFEELLKK